MKSDRSLKQRVFRNEKNKIEILNTRLCLQLGEKII